jgi:tetratricopeptide (TPR) repeat protein
MSIMHRSRSSHRITGFVAELKRRRVLQMGGAYIVAAWLGMEIFHFLQQQFQAPDWANRLLAIMFVAGLPLTMVLAWIVQVQDDGRWAIDPERGDHRTVAAAIGLGLLVTAGFSWLVLPERESEAIYEPLPNSVAVLPFESGDALYWSVMDGLSQSPDLTLVRLDSVEQHDDLYGFGRSFRVAYLVAGDSELQLLDIAGEEVAWSQKLESDIQHVIDISHEVTSDLLKAMGLPALSKREFAGTDNAMAYADFLAGSRHASSPDAGSLERAVAAFQSAIDRDPVYARAYVSLADALYVLLDTAPASDVDRRALETRAEAAVQEARELDPDSAGAFSLLGLSASHPQSRYQAFEHALELDPDHDVSFYRYAREMRRSGDLLEAERLIDKAIALRPMSARYREEQAAIREGMGSRVEDPSRQ